MKTADFDFDLPPELIAQTPAPQRDQSRLLVLHRRSGQIEHRRFPDLLEYLQPDDILVLNNSRVVPARLRGINAHTNGPFEILLLEENAVNDWWVMLRPGKRARVGTQITVRDQDGNRTNVNAMVREKNEEGHRRLHFSGTPNIANELENLGEVPLPPYIHRDDIGSMEADRERYQTVFAQPAGSVAAPTAGLHFTESLLSEIRSRGTQSCFITLHVGLGTFAPVKTEIIAAHKMHAERFEINEETARRINAAKSEGRRVIAVGTTTLRVLETFGSATARREKLAQAANVHCTPDPQRKNGPLTPALSPSEGEREGKLCGSGFMRRRNLSSPRLIPGAGKTRIFIYPPYDFRMVDALLTNFHLPRSTLLMLVSAFAAPKETRGREVILSAYAEAIRERYRFFSYGDVMLIL